MRIRSITCFIDPGWPLQLAALNNIGLFSQAARKIFSDAGYEVQNARLATTPFAELVNASEAVGFARALEAAARDAGFDDVSIGPASPAHMAAYEIIPDILVATQHIFASGNMTLSPALLLGGPTLLREEQACIAMPGLRACAAIIHRAAKLSQDGFGNMRFAALANVPPHAPFFPAAYHHPSQPPAFALALEGAELAVSVISASPDLTSARQELQAAIERTTRDLARIADRLSADHHLPFAGIDFTLAPFPETSRSTGAAIEGLGVPAVGLPGSLAAATILAETIGRARYPRTGFNGLMLPVLEDATLAARAAQGLLSINDLLLYSTVCGTGLDTLPLPGDATVEQLTAVLLDVAALSLRLNKPLTARLMPIPGKKAGDPTNFDFSYFANSRVLALPEVSLSGLLAGADVIPLNHRSPK